MKRLSRHLINSSQEAIILALEVYNKPTIRYRVEAFCFLFCNAWELLSKAKILETHKKETAICYKKKRGEPRRTLSLRDCLKRVYANENDPARRNIEDIAIIRDSAAHFIVPELEVIYQGLFQSGVLNYVHALEDWFGTSILEKCTPALLSLMANVDGIQPTKLKRKYGKDILDFIEHETSRLAQAEIELSDPKYRIPVEYKLVLTKSPGKADITLTSGASDKIGLVLEVAKDLHKTHPYLQKEVIAEVNRQLPEEQKINSYDFQAFLFKNKIKGQSQYHHKITKPETHRYSDKLVDLILQKVNNDNEYINRCRASYSTYLRKKQASKK